MLLAFHKPYGVLSQFTPDGSRHRTLADFSLPRGVYPLGRLDAESEGLLLLSDDGSWNRKLLHPSFGHRRVYWAQVEREPGTEALEKLRTGVVISGYRTLPARCAVIQPPPDVPERVPPIRFRKNVATSWIALELVEGKNHQVRKMTAAVGHPTLRLLRVQIAEVVLGDLAPGAFYELHKMDLSHRDHERSGRPG